MGPKPSIRQLFRCLNSPHITVNLKLFRCVCGRFCGATQRLNFVCAQQASKKKKKAYVRHTPTLTTHATHGPSFPQQRTKNEKEERTNERTNERTKKKARVWYGPAAAVVARGLRERAKEAGRLGAHFSSAWRARIWLLFLSARLRPSADPPRGPCWVPGRLGLRLAVANCRRSAQTMRAHCKRTLPRQQKRNADRLVRAERSSPLYPS
jgi:hypothetical protein